ncbi:tetratricopeptide repeat-containing sensor histidine kinase [Niabella beijingensis]|uniref:tetratricopeptide repeat-containing sensor histidine kinase n=1 Tax=Niabella beijingensis TaxID=2872700 RepID=UPI001CBCE222|nr:ATP-binding protein [Niabella beijingensis]MBZ4189853.1 tetratricopeptide repeat protein [Niabella beijingensis]
MRILKMLMLACIALNGNAQKQGLAAIDSMLRELSVARSDTDKLRLQYRIGEAYAPIDIEKSMQYAREGLSKSKAIKWDKGIAAFCISLGNNLCDQSKYDSAIHYYEEAYTINKKTGNEKGACSALMNIGTAYQNRGLVLMAMRYLQEAMPIAEKLDDPYLLALIYNGIATTYILQENQTDALKYAFKAYSVSRENRHPANIAMALTTIGTSYVIAKDTLRARQYLLQALPLVKEANNTEREAMIYYNLGFIAPTAEEQLRYALQSKQLWDALNPDHSMAVANLVLLGTAAKDMALGNAVGAAIPDTIPQNKNDLLAFSKRYLAAAINMSNATGDQETLSNAAKQLAETEAALGNYPAAYQYLQTHLNLRDSLYSQESKNKIASLESQREIDAREKQLQINKLALSNARRTRTALMGGAAFLLIIGGLLFYQNRSRRRTNTTLLLLNNELDEANKVKTKFFGILSHDLRSPIINLINFLHLQKEMPGLFDQERTERHQKDLTASAENLLDTMEAMLLWSKSQMERFAPEKKMVPVDRLFDHIRKQLPVNNPIAVSFQNTEQLSVSTDEDYLKTIMYNLTANAVKALQDTPDGQIRWHVRQKGHQVLLTITDNGPGIHKEQMEALYNENAVVGTRYGLGLHLIRDLAKAIQCKISFQPAAGGGASFTLSI